MILLKAWTNGACLNEADYAIIAAGPGWVDAMLATMKMAASIKKRSMHFNYISFFNGAPMWMPFDDDLASLMDDGILVGDRPVDKDELARVSAELCLLSNDLWIALGTPGVADQLRVDGGTVRVDEKSAHWRTYIKNTNAVATTAEISKELLERIAKGDILMTSKGDSE